MSAGPPSPSETPPRVLGQYDSGEPGPLLIVTAAIHGNEPAGIHALSRVFDALAEREPRLRGRLVGLLGNRGALARNQRYVAADLNRVWSARHLAELAAADPAADRDERMEQRELLTCLEAELARPHERVVHLDLHSTSAESPPFTVLGQDVESRRLAAAIGVPAIFGILKDVEGSVLDFAASRGIACVVLEGGQHQAETTVEHHESGVWIALEATGMLARDSVPELARHKARIERSVVNVPDAVEVCFRYAIDPDEKFVMLPGFRSFQRVYPGQLLALGGRNGRQEIRCPVGAILLMPRYQGQGGDGFYLARAIDRVA
jgi:succinylglutamate desuccinylase